MCLFGPVLVVLFVPTQQMFSGSVVRAVFCEEDHCNWSHFCSPGFGDMSKLFGPSENAEAPIVSRQQQRGDVCGLPVCGCANSAQ